MRRLLKWHRRELPAASPSEVSTEQPKYEISLTEPYWRAKRASLAFSSLLAIASFATSKASYSGFTIDIFIIKWFLAIAAGYHVILFWNEYTAMRRRHTALTIDNPHDIDGRVADYEAQIERWNGQITTAANHLQLEANKSISPSLAEISENSALPKLEEAVSSLKKVIDTHLNEIGVRKTLHEVIDRQISKINEICKEISTKIDSSLERQEQIISQSVSKSKTTMESAAEGIRSASDALIALRRDISSLSREIFDDQKRSVRWLDFGSVMSLFVLSVLIALFVPVWRSSCADIAPAYCLPVPDDAEAKAGLSIEVRLGSPPPTQQKLQAARSAAPQPPISLDREAVAYHSAR